MDRLNEIRARLEELEQRNELTDEERAEVEALIEEARTLRFCVAYDEWRAVEVARIRDAASRPGHTEPTIPAVQAPNVNTRTESDLYDTSTIRHESRQDLTARAETIIEKSRRSSDEARAAAQRILATADGDDQSAKAEHFVRTASPDYHEEFRQYLRTGQVGPHLDETRTALSTTAGNGGYLIPFELDPTVILANSGVTNPIRGIANVATMSTNIWHGVSTAGVTAEWIGEAAEVADASPTFTQPTITAYKADAHVIASMEVTQDSSVASELTRLFADARDRLEAAAHATGSGSAQPYGIITRVAAVTTSRVAATTNNSYGAVDVYAVASALPPRYRPGSAWIAELTTINSTRQFDSAGGSSFWANLGMGQPEQLLGRPIYECSSVDGPLATGDDDILLLGDFSNYYIRDRMGMEILFDPIVLGSNRRPTGQVSWTAFWRTGADCVNTAAFRLLRV